MELLHDRAYIAAGTILHGTAETLGDAAIVLEVLTHSIRHTEAAIPAMAEGEPIEEEPHQGPMAG